MSMTHTWNGASGPYIFDPAQYLDGNAFAPGDTLVVSSGYPTVGATDGNVAAFRTGTFLFTIPGESAGLGTDNEALDAASTIAVSGPGTLEWLMQGQFVNNGAIKVGSTAVSSNAVVSMATLQPATLANQGSIAVRNSSVLKLLPSASAGAFVNTAGSVLSVASGSQLVAGGYYGHSDGGPGNLNTTNNGVIEVTAAAGRSTSASFKGSYTGSGLLSVRGTQGAAASAALAEISGAASGVFDVASGQLLFNTTPVDGSVSFLDNNAALIIDRGAGTSHGTPGNAFGATILGFQAGDVIALNGAVAFTGFAYDPASHLLTITGAGGAQVGQFKFAGSYAQGDFQVTPAGLGGVQGLSITTVSTSQAIPSFLYTDNATGTSGSSAGQQYDGPVSTLQSQYIWASPDGASIIGSVPNVFLQGGVGNDALTASAGSNVLDGGLGSNFVTGATGADGGTDTFFLDGAAGTTWDTIVNFHPGDSATLWGFVPGQSAMAWAANEGAAGHTGATIHAALAGAGTAINGSLTFAGLGLADAQSKLSLTPGTAGGRSYLYVHYNA